MNKSFFYFIVGAVIPILLIVGIWKWLLGGQLGFHFLPEKKFNIHTEHTEDDEVLLRIAGSNTLGEKIIPEIAKAYLQNKGATQVKIEEDDDEESKEKTVVGKLNNKNVSIEISHEGTSSGFSALKDEEADIVMASRQINPNEAINLSSYGDMFSHNAEHIIGLDGIAVIVNHSNGLRTLTMEQAAAIFSGKIRSWSELPNSNLSENIKIYVRDSKSGTYEVFNNIVLNGKGVN